MLKVEYRVVERSPRKFFVEALSADRAAWRCIGEYPTSEEANARKVKLEQILRGANRDSVGGGR
jgi:hypothetical protein